MKTGERRRIPEQNRQFARDMRVDATKAENMLWQAIRNNQLEGFRFKRQVPIENYIVDFICFEARLIIEVDGSQHVESQNDELRDQVLSSAGFRILRFWNDDITRNLDGACLQILMGLKNTGE
jgi:very-short-patch-repair endonuclease